MPGEACPSCGSAHRRFPRRCYYDAMADNSHAIIARLASHGDPKQKEFAAQALEKVRRMVAYIDAAGFTDAPELKKP